MEAGSEIKVVTVTKYMPKRILNFENSSNYYPLRICMCISTSGHPECDITNTTMEIYGYAVKKFYCLNHLWITD